MQRSKGPIWKKSLSVLLSVCLVPWQTPALLYAQGAQDDNKRVVLAGGIPVNAAASSGQKPPPIVDALGKFSVRQKTASDDELREFVRVEISAFQDADYYLKRLDELAAKLTRSDLKPQDFDALSRLAATLARLLPMVSTRLQETSPRDEAKIKRVAEAVSRLKTLEPLIAEKKAIAVIEPENQPGFLPTMKPLGQFFSGFPIQPEDHVVTRESGRGGGCQVKHGNEKQGPKNTPPGSLDRLHGVKPDDYVGQSRRPRHQGQG